MSPKARRRRKFNARTVIREHKKSSKCSRCGEDHYACLEFHHTNGDKEFNVSTGPGLGYSVSKILKEIKKCIILCANCHRKHHWIVDRR